MNNNKKKWREANKQTATELMGLSTIVAVSWISHAFVIHFISSITICNARHHPSRHYIVNPYSWCARAWFSFVFISLDSLFLFRWAHLNRSVGCRIALPIYLHWCACTFFIWHQSSHSSSVPRNTIYELECIASFACSLAQESEREEEH